MIDINTIKTINYKDKEITTYYEKSESIKFQGNNPKVHKMYEEKYNVNDLGKGNGNYIATKNSDIIICVESNGITKNYSCRNFILKNYKKDKLTKGLFNKFIKDLENNKINLEI